MNKITVKTVVNCDLEKTWEYFTNPIHINNWCHASSDWAAKDAENDLRIGGRFKTTMYAIDGSASFDFGGVYDGVDLKKSYSYTMDGDDKRQVSVMFSSINEATTEVVETFDPENINNEERQQQGWQAILDNFKSYTESN